MPVNSGGKQMNEDSNNVDKDTIESKVESKQIAQDIYFFKRVLNSALKKASDCSRYIADQNKVRLQNLTFHINLLVIICQGQR